MPTTELRDGLFLTKVRRYGGSRAVTIPPKVADAAQLSDGFFVGVLAIGPCVVMVRIAQGTPEKTEEEIRIAFEAAMEAWKTRNCEVSSR